MSAGEAGWAAAGGAAHSQGLREMAADAPAEAEGVAGTGAEGDADCVVHVTVAPRLWRRSSSHGGGNADDAATAGARPVAAAAAPEPPHSADTAAADDVGAISPYYFYRKTLSLADFAHAQPWALLHTST